MIAGKLNDWVTLYSPETSVNQYGEERTTFVRGKRIHAQIDWKSGNTSIVGDRIFSSQSIEVVIAYPHIVATGWRLMYAEELYTVNAIKIDRARGLKRLYVTRVINE